MFNEVAGIVEFVFEYPDKRQDVFIRCPFSHLEGAPGLEVLKFLVGSLDELLTVRVFQHLFPVLWLLRELVTV